MDLRLTPGATERSHAEHQNFLPYLLLDQTVSGPSPLFRAESVDSVQSPTPSDLNVCPIPSKLSEQAHLDLCHAGLEEVSTDGPPTLLRAESTDSALSPLFPGELTIDTRDPARGFGCDPVNGWGVSPAVSQQSTLFTTNSPHTRGGEKGAWRKEMIRNAHLGLPGVAPDVVSAAPSRKFVPLVEHTQEDDHRLNLKKKPAVKWVPKRVEAGPAGSDMWCGTSKKLERFSGNLKKGRKTVPTPSEPVRHSTATRVAHAGFTDKHGQSSVHRTSYDGTKLLSNRESRIARSSINTTLPDACSSIVSFARRKIDKTQRARLPRDYGGVPLRERPFREIVLPYEGDDLERDSWVVGASFVTFIVFVRRVLFGKPCGSLTEVPALGWGSPTRPWCPKPAPVGGPKLPAGMNYTGVAGLSEFRDPGFFLGSVLIAPILEEILKRVIPFLSEKCSLGDTGMYLVSLLISFETVGHFAMCNGNRAGWAITYMISVMHCCCWSLPLLLGWALHTFVNLTCWWYDVRFDTFTFSTITTLVGGSSLTSITIPDPSVYNGVASAYEPQDPGYFLSCVCICPLVEEFYKRLLPYVFAQGWCLGDAGAFLVTFCIFLEFNAHIQSCKGNKLGWLVSLAIVGMHYWCWRSSFAIGWLVHTAVNYYCWWRDIRFDTVTFGGGSTVIGGAFAVGGGKKKKKNGGNRVGARAAASAADEPVEPSELDRFLSALPEYVVVYVRDAPCVALYRGEECYLPFGQLDLVTKSGLRLCMPKYESRADDGRLGVLSGYEPIHDGCYKRIDYSKCVTVEEARELQGETQYQLRPCGGWEMLQPITLGTIRTDAQEVYVCAHILSAAQRVCRGKTTEAQFHGLIGNLSASFPCVNRAHIFNVVLKHTYDLICARSLAANQVIRAGHVLAVNVPLKDEEARDMLGLGGFADFADAQQNKINRFDRGKERYLWYPYLRKIPGVALNGTLCMGYTVDPVVAQNGGGELVVMPATTPRWNVVINEGNVRFMENYAFEHFHVGAAMPLNECRLAYFPDSNFAKQERGDLIETGYRSRGLVIQGTTRASQVTVLDVSPTALLDAVYGRALFALPGEAGFANNQRLVLLHIKALDPELFDMMMPGILTGNDRQTSATFYRDKDIFDAEMARLDGPDGLCTGDGSAQFGLSHQPWRNFEDDIFMRVGRRAAAVALIDRMRSMETAKKIEDARSSYIGGVLLVQFGCLIWYCSTTLPLALVGMDTLVYRIFFGGSLASIITLGCLQAYEVVIKVMTTAGKQISTVYSVDEAGFTHKYMRFPIFGSSIYSMWMAAHRKHVKMKQYLRTLGMHWLHEPEAFLSPHVDLTVTAADVIQKAHEGSKFGKVARFIVSCGFATLAMQIAANYIKGLFAGARDLGRLLRSAFPGIPSLDYEQVSLDALPTDMEDDHAVSRLMNYSDDEFYELSILGTKLYVCADASSADSCVSGAILLGILPVLYRLGGSDIPLTTLTYNYVRPWKVTSPHNRRNSFLMRATDAAMPSGDSNTTLLQNIFSVMRGASFAAQLNLTLHLMNLKRADERGKVGEYRPTQALLESMLVRLVQRSATSCGGISTVEIASEPSRSTLLKRTLMRDTDGRLCYMMVLGAILSNFGGYAGDLTHMTLGITIQEFDRLPIPARWERHLCSVVAGLVHEPSNIVLDALRLRFPKGVAVAGVTAEERFRFELQKSSSDRSRRTIPLSELLTRYGGRDHEWVEFADMLRHIEYGQILEHVVMDRIRADYGVPFAEPL